MARNYRPMLEIAEELARFQRYLGPTEEQEEAKLKAAFAAERRKFVYDVVREPGEKSEVVPSIDSQLDRALASGNYAEWSIDHVRGELHQHIGKQINSSPFVRFGTRWGPPVFGIIAIAAYFYAQSLR